MPIVYQPSAPAGALISAARNNRNNTGIGAGVPLSEMYAEEMQNKQQSAMLNAQLMARDRQGGDQLQEERAQFAARNNFSPRDQGMAQAAMAEQAQRGAIQSQLQQDDFTHSDNVRLQQLQQGKSDILQQHSDGQITTPERDQMLLQLHTGDRGISVLDLRKKATEAKYQAEHTKQIQQQTQIALDVEKRKARLDEDRMAYSAAEIGNKLTFIPDIQAATDLRAQVKADMPELPPNQIEKIVKEQLQSEGKGSTWYPDSKGVPKLAKEVLHGPDKANAQAGEGKGAKGKGAPEFDPSRAYHDAEAAVDKQVAAGTLKPEDAQAEIEKRVAARQAFHEKYSGDKAAAKTVGKAAPFDLNNPTSGSEKQRQQAGMFMQKAGEYRDRQDLPPEVRGAAMKDVAVAARLTSKWLTPDGALSPDTPKYIRDELEKINARLAKVPTAEQMAATQVPMGPGGRIPTQPGGDHAAELIARLHAIQAKERAAGPATSPADATRAGAVSSLPAVEQAKREAMVAAAKRAEPAAKAAVRVGSLRDVRDATSNLVDLGMTQAERLAKAKADELRRLLGGY